MIANPSIEQMPREKMASLQLKRLQKQLQWAMDKSAFYYRKFTDAAIKPNDIQTLADIERLPFTTVDELQEASVYNLLTLPLSAVLRVSRQGYSHSFVKMYTGGDLAHQMEHMTRALVAQGMNNAVVAGLLGDASDSRLMDVQYALESMGVTVVLLGNEPEHVKELVTTCHIDILISDFKQIMQLIVMLQASEIDAEDLSLPKIVCLEETLQNPNNFYIKQRLGSAQITMYNSSVMGCGGLLFPCAEGENGCYHVQEDYFYPEIVEYGTDQIIHEAGRAGELVLTSLCAEAMPIFRYRTGEVVMRVEAPCRCGRTLMRVTTPTAYAGAVWQTVTPV